MKRILYLGLKAPAPQCDVEWVHYPIIKTTMRPAANEEIAVAFQQLPRFTHLMLTSQSALLPLFTYADFFQKERDHFAKMTTLVVGQATAKAALSYGLSPLPPPALETAEGLITLLESLSLENSYFLWPHSALSRPMLPDYFRHKGIPLYDFVAYDTLPHYPVPYPNLTSMDEVIFTSPSTVEAFFAHFKEIPTTLKLTPIGPITEAKLHFFQKQAILGDLKGYSL